MTPEEEKKENLSLLAGFIDKKLQEFYKQEMGFILLCFPFNTKDGICDYISNGQREDAIKALIEASVRLKFKG